MDDAEFAAAVEAALVASDEETPTETTEPEAAPESEETAAEVTDEPEAVEEIAEEPEAPQFGDEVNAYLSKYGGDVSKALEAAIAAQSKIGEQGQELGELRRMVQEIMDRPEPKAPTSPFMSEQVSEAIVENPSQVAQWALQTEQPHIYEAAIAEWYEQSPMQAGRFERALERELLKAELTNQISPTIEATQERERARSVTEAHRSLTQKYSDFAEVLQTATSDETAGLNRNLLAQLMEEDPQAAMETTYRWIKAERGSRAAEVQAQRTEEVREEKRQAAVVTAETTNTTPEPTITDKLRASMLDPEPWSVRHGLTSE